MAKHNETGKWGEHLAMELLASKGYAIVEQNWRSRNAEIDIVAMHRNRIVFVEVKTRTDKDLDPLEAVNRRKISKMVSAASSYIAAKNIMHEYQFDLIAVTGTPDNYKIEHIPDAFLPPLRTYR